VRIPRQQVLDALRDQVAQGRPLIGTSAGNGLSARCAEDGEADLIIIYNSGRYRMAGRGSSAGLLPYGDANAIVVEMAAEVLPIVKHTPVIAGVCGTDPFRQMPVFLEELKRLGFSGVQNFPTVGLFEGAIRQTFEETGMGFDLEIELMRTARAMDMLTVPYVFDEAQAAAMAEAGADVLVPHVGTTTKGTIGAQTAISMDECVRRITAMQAAARAVNPDILVLCHGGPIAEPQDAQAVLDRVPGVVGFVGASSIERLPAERAITETMHQFKSISFTGGTDVEG
jgi:predicted TIM-barrel enzyme